MRFGMDSGWIRGGFRQQGEDLSTTMVPTRKSALRFESENSGCHGRGSDEGRQQQKPGCFRSACPGMAERNSA